MSVYETPLRAPKTPEYNPNPDEDMNLFPNTAKTRSQNNVHERSCSPLKSIVNTDVSRLDKLEHQLSELKDLICTRFQSDNKHVEKYSVQQCHPYPRITNAKSAEKTQYRNVLSQKGTKMKHTLKTFQTYIS